MTEQLAYRVPQVAKLLGTSEHAVRRMIARRQLPARNWGRRVLVLRDDLAAAIRDLPPRPAA
jgi:excisionase family DNA binding protein